MSFGCSATGRPLSNCGRRILNRCTELAQRLLPQRCLLCTAPSLSQILCAPCYGQLPWLPAVRCEQCALPLHKNGVCGACLSAPPHFDRVSAAFSYIWPLAALIHRYKYAGDLALAGMFAQALLAEKLSADVIVPMPLAPLRLRERGFNQALEIARHLSRSTGIALAAKACRRVRDSAPQAKLPWNERARNIRKAFVCDADFRGKRVAVVDDVLTTGATLNELARSLRKAGASEVQGWVVARTLKQESGFRIRQNREA